MRKNTSAVPRYENYKGTKRYHVSHPAHKDLIVAAPDEASAMVAACNVWGMQVRGDCICLCGAIDARRYKELRVLAK